MADVEGVTVDLEKHRGLVVSVAKNLAKKYRLGRFMDELVALGWEGLKDAEQRYDAGHGTKFSTFAYYRVRGAMLDGCRTMGWVTRRRTKKLSADAMFNEHQLTSYEDQREPAAEETLTDVGRALDDMIGDAATIYLALEQAEPQGLEGVADGAPGPEALVEAADVSRVLRREMEALDEPSRRVLEQSFYEGRTLDEIGEEMGCSKSWASRLRRSAIQKLRVRLQELEYP